MALAFKEAVTMQKEYEVPDKGIVFVEKKILAESGDYNLNGDRYYKPLVATGIYQIVTLSQVALINPSEKKIKSLLSTDSVPFLPMSDLNVNSYTFTPKQQRSLDEVKAGYTYFEEHDILIAKITPCFENGKIGIASNLAHGIGFGSTEYHVIRCSNKILPKYLYHLLNRDDFRKMAKNQMTGSAGQKRVPKQVLENYSFPLPPLPVQEEIVAELDSYQKIIDGAKQVVDNWKPRIDIDPEWKMTKIMDYVKESALGLVKDKASQSSSFTHPYVKMNNITYDGSLDLSSLVYVNASHEEMNRFSLKDGDFLYNTRNSIDLVGKSCVYHGEDRKYLYNNNILRIRFSADLNPDFVNYVMNSDYGKQQINTIISGTTSVAAVYQKDYFQILIPIPVLSTQLAIVESIENEQKLVDVNRKLISLYEKKIKDRIDGIWKA